MDYLAVVSIASWLELGTPHWGVLGFCIGLPTAILAIVCIEVLYMRFIDWEKCMVQAEEPSRAPPSL